MRWLQKVQHLMNDDVLKKILRLLHEFGIQADVTGPVIAATPLGFHSLKEIPLHFHLQLPFPFLDDDRHDFVQECLLPFVHHLGASTGSTAGTNGQGDAFS